MSEVSITPWRLRIDPAQANLRLGAALRSTLGPWERMKLGRFLDRTGAVRRNAIGDMAIQVMSYGGAYQVSVYQEVSEVKADSLDEALVLVDRQLRATGKWKMR